MTKIKRIDEFVNDIQTNDEATVNDRVMFRKIMKPAKFKGVVTAVFPDLLSDPTGDYKPRNFVMCYDIIGQHSDCDLNVIKMNTVPATPDEYAEILDEIQSRGYENPIVMTPEEQKAFFRKSPRYMNENLVNEEFGDQRIENEIAAFNKQAGMLREKLTAIIVRVLGRHNGEIRIGDYDEFGGDGDIEPIWVLVDDGNGNYISSRVLSVIQKGGSFKLETEGDPDYSCDYMDEDNLVDIYHALVEIEEHPEWSEK